MRFRVSVFASTLLLAGVLPASAAPERSEVGLDRIRGDFESRLIDRETWILESFRYAFGAESLDPRYASVPRAPIKCFTPVILRYEEHKASLSAAAVAEIEGYLNPSQLVPRATYVSPSGKFEFEYVTTGGNAVPPDDLSPANGIPDFVERCAEYADQTWDTLITNVGFYVVNLPGDGTYDMSFQDLGAGFYGFTSVAGAGLTEIVLHNDFAGTGWPGPNDDPDGDALGRAKATIAHEFKHAIQFVTSGWSEGQWVELDAMWAEDIVFDESNDYHNWVDNGSQSQLDAPEVRLDNTSGQGNYEDVLWNTYLSETFGNQFLVDFWEYRDANPGSNVKSSYQNVLMSYGSEWDVAYPRYLEFCWFTGARAEPPFGFPDAPDLHKMELIEGAITSYPWTRGGSVDQLAGHARRFGPGSATGAPRIQFDGDDAHENWTVSIIAEEPDGSFTIVRPTLDANKDMDYTVPMAFPDLAYCGVIVTNSRRGSGQVSYSMTVLEESATDVAVSGGPLDRLAMEPARPNPFRASTSLAYSIPSGSVGSIRVVNVEGRAVRTLRSGALPSGAGDLRWDGRDDAGRQVPAGVYWAIIETGPETVGKKVVVLR